MSGVRFPLLLDEGNGGYLYAVENLTDCRNNGDDLRYWVEHFVQQAPSVTRYALEANRFLLRSSSPAAALPEDVAQQAAARFVEEWEGWSAGLETSPVSVWDLCVEKERRLRQVGFSDAYAHVKYNENKAALCLLPALLRELDAMSDDERLHTLFEGVFAGNIFDLGSFDTLKLFEQGDGGGAADFLCCRAKLPPRPWFVDDFAAIQKRFADASATPYKKAILFVEAEVPNEARPDNAGTDVILGMVPLARELLRRGTQVVLTANATPALNDITHPELMVVMKQVTEMDPVLAAALGDGRLKLVASGNGCPLIDLGHVGVELAKEAESADLVILEGMGRALQSNHGARFKCDAMKLAMVKDGHVAQKLGCPLMACFCRFEQRT